MANASGQDDPVGAVIRMLGLVLQPADPGFVGLSIRRHRPAFSTRHL